MKKRTVKDFITLYTQDDEEMLVLIQNGTCADKTFWIPFGQHIPMLLQWLMSRPGR